MIGSLNPKDKTATIVGAGVSGLLIAYTLKKRGFNVKILEASSRSGGLIDTISTVYGPSEKAAHSLLVTPEVQSLFDELNIKLVPVHPQSKARFIYRNGKARRFPLTFWEALYTAFRFFSKPKPQIAKPNETLSEWCLRYLGRPALQFLLSPFVTGVFACDPDELNAKITFPKLISHRPDLSLFRHLRQLPKSTRPQMMAPEKGMGELISKLQSALKEEILLNSPVTSLDQINSVGNLILTLPAPELSKLLSKVDPHSAELLLQVQYSPLVTATVFIEEDAFLKAPPKGVGVLVPKDQGLRILGVLYNSSSFSNRVSDQKTSSYTVMIGGTKDREATSLTDDTLKELINNNLDKIFGLSKPPIHIEITKWNRAIPVYSQALKNAQESLKTGFCSRPGHIIFTNYSKEVSLRGIIGSLHNI